MKPEDVMAMIAKLVVERYAQAVKTIDDATDQRTPVEQLKVLGLISVEGRRVSVFHAQGLKVQAGLAKLEAEAVKASAQAAMGGAERIGAANENEVETPQEMEMDDDTGRTPERVDAIYRELDRRLAALAAEREAKGFGGRDGYVVAGGGESGPGGGPGAASDSTA